MKKGKILISLVTILVVTLAVGNIVSLATEDGKKVTITAKKDSNTVNDTKTEEKNETVGAVNGTVNKKVANNSDKETDNSTNETKNKVSNNSNKYNTVSSSKLPKAGEDTTVIFVVLGFIASAVYAYKKISDYNL